MFFHEFYMSLPWNVGAFHGFPWLFCATFSHPPALADTWLLGAVLTSTAGLGGAANYLSICLSIYPSIHQSIHPSISTNIYIYISVCIHWLCEQYIKCFLWKMIYDYLMTSIHGSHCYQLKPIEFSSQVSWVFPSRRTLLRVANFAGEVPKSGVKIMQILVIFGKPVARGYILSAS